MLLDARTPWAPGTRTWSRRRAPYHHRTRQGDTISSRQSVAPIVQRKRARPHAQQPTALRTMWCDGSVRLSGRFLCFDRCGALDLGDHHRPIRHRRGQARQHEPIPHPVHRFGRRGIVRAKHANGCIRHQWPLRVRSRQSAGIEWSPGVDTAGSSGAGRTEMT